MPWVGHREPTPKHGTSTVLPSQSSMDLTALPTQGQVDGLVSHGASDAASHGYCPHCATDVEAEEWMDRVVGEVRALSTGGKLVAFDRLGSTMTLEVGGRQLVLKLSSVMFGAVQEFLDQRVDVVIEMRHQERSEPSALWVVELGRPTSMPKCMEGDLDAVADHFQRGLDGAEGDGYSSGAWQEYVEGGVVVGLDSIRSSAVLESTGQLVEVRIPSNLWGDAQRAIGRGVDIGVRGKYLRDGSRYSSVATQIKPWMMPPKRSVEDFVQTFGCFREDLSDPAIEEYFRTLRWEDG